jgi:hypothetical protein
MIELVRSAYDAPAFLLLAQHFVSAAVAALEVREAYLV